MPTTPATGNVYGGVSYSYDIGQYDVTLNQYATFLNAVAQVDPFNLYNTSLATNAAIAGITRTGANGSYQYSVIGDGQPPGHLYHVVRRRAHCQLDAERPAHRLG